MRGAKVEKLFRFIALALLGCIALAGCGSSQVPFESWERSQAAKERMLVVAERTRTDVLQNGRLIQTVAGTKGASPLQALERYFLTLPPEEIVRSSARQGTFTRMFLNEVAGTKKFKKDQSSASMDSAMRRLWIVQLFRTLPNEIRTRALQSKIVLPFADPENPGNLRPVEGAPIEQLEQLADILAEDLSPTRNLQFGDFTLASEIN
jgi:hypothetical protein